MRDLTSLNEFLVENPMQQMMVKMVAKMSGGKVDDEILPKTYLIPGKNVDYWVLVSSCYGWDHVSVSLRTKESGEPVERCPRWEEMCFIKEKFFEDDEYAMQFHPSKAQYVNNHPYVLHLWKPTDISFPVPPSFMV